MSYNEIPNILIDSVVLPNKPLSNLEIIDAAQKLSLCGFRGVFLTDTIPTKTKLNECGVLNLDSSSGDGTHWVMWFKKDKDKLYFDSYGVQPLARWLLIWISHQYFTIANESNKTVRCFANIYVSSHWSSFRWEIIFKL